MKKSIYILILIMMIVSSLFLLGSFQTKGKGKMKGVVMDEATGEPIEGVKVKLFSMKGQANHEPSPVTGKDGSWKAVFIRDGMWNIDFEKEGYEPKKIRYNVSTHPEAKKPVITIYLKKMKGVGVPQDILKDLENGNQLFSEKKYEEALAKFEGILEKTPTAYIIYKNIGNCYFAMNDYEKAIENYQRILEKEPENAEIMVLIGNAYANAKDLKRAEEWYGKVPFEKIDNIDTLYNMGIIFYNSANYKEAVRYFKKATEVNPEFADAFYQLGMTYTGMNKVPEAIEALKKFMELAPDSPNYQTAKAIVDAFSKSQ